jgi:hypothetical protein
VLRKNTGEHDDDDNVYSSAEDAAAAAFDGTSSAWFFLLAKMKMIPSIHERQMQMISRPQSW